MVQWLGAFTAEGPCYETWLEICMGSFKLPGVAKRKKRKSLEIILMEIPDLSPISFMT